MQPGSGTSGFRPLSSKLRARKTTQLVAFAVTCICALFFHASLALAGHDHEGGDAMREASRAQQRQAEEAAKQMRQQALEAQRQAEREQREAVKQALQLQREQQRQAEKEQREAAKQALQLQREQQRQAEKDQREASKQALQLQREQQRQAEKDQREASRQSQRQDSEPVQKSDNDGGQTSAPPQPNGSQNQVPQLTTNVGTGVAKSGRDASATPTRVEKHDKTENPESAAGKEKNDKDQKPEAAQLDTGPPPTVEKWIKQLFSPSAPAPVAEITKPVVQTVAGPAQAPGSKSEAAAKPPTKAAVVNAQANPTSVPTTKPTANSKPSGGRLAPIELPSLPPLPEVLAVNATPQTVQRALALGFTAKPTTALANLKFAVTRLLPPNGMSSIEAQALLKRELPKGSFAPNQQYRIYRTASDTKALPAGSRATNLTPGDTGCEQDRCFGTDIIGWKPVLRGCVSGVKIGIIDTSIDTKHPAFAHKQLELKHFGHDGKPGPNWHGTGITALLAGDAASGTPGLIPDANFYVADIFHGDENSEPASDTISMLRAFDWLEAKGVKIINMSLAGPPDELIRRAVDKLSAKGILMVAAAGNEGPSAGPSYPAAYDQVIAVTAVNKDMQNYRYANRGSYIDISAPGVAIWTALPGAQGGYHSGTSFATPYVTAALAAIYPRLTAKTQAAALQQISFKDLGAPGPDPIYGQGLLIAPTTCDAGLLAKAAIPATVARQASTPSASFASPPSSVTEQLPWLGLSQTGN
jgi:Subtilase family